LGANGILGIGTSVVDCGIDCEDATYTYDRSSPTVSPAIYYDCQGKVDSTLCVAAKIPANAQVKNPVALLDSAHRNGIVLVMPPIPASQIGAAAAHGELIFGIGSQANNTIPSGTPQIYLGTSNVSYLSINTQYKGHAFTESVLDTGTNAMTFYDASIVTCDSKPMDFSSNWYCPSSTLTNLEAILSDGDPLSSPAGPSTATIKVNFQVANYNVLFNSGNMAFVGAAGANNSPNSQYNPKINNGQSKYIPDTQTFIWGMPFFYGKKVYMSIWDMYLDPNALINPPMYAWTLL
jgi:hypothetical protein